ncbi:ricin-type beta-trefoil lectin domain protein [Streptomyces sp. NPDC093516]|uniref:ricin-type beta-trefoil lectin domain protein n=1 Tax=Streptomyces sp. NPDC093516 TaxID=3155304 RepID=UPI00343CE78E
MTTSKPDGSAEEPTAVATGQAEAEDVEETEPSQVAPSVMEGLNLFRPALPRGVAVPSAMTEPEAEESAARSARTEPVPQTDSDPESEPDAETGPAAETGLAAQAASDPKTAESTPGAATATVDEAASSNDAQNSAARTAVQVAPGRPHKSLLAGAAIFGALLISVPFLVSGDNGDDGRGTAKAAATPGTVLEGLSGTAPGVVGSESPSAPGASAATPGKKGPKVVTTAGPDGKPKTITARPESVKPPGGRKSSTGGKTSAAAGGGVAAGSGSGSGGSSTASRTHSGTSSDTTVHSTPQSQSTTGGVQIYSHASGRCIGVANSPNAPVGSKVVIWDCYNVSYQRWKFVNGTVQSEGKCMNVSGGSTANGAVIIWTSCNGSGAQQFRLNSSHDLTNPQSGNKCVDVKDKSTANGANLQLWTCAGTSNQKWSTRTP